MKKNILLFFIVFFLNIIVFAQEMKLVSQSVNSGLVYSIAMSKDGKYFATSDKTGLVIIWNTNLLKQMKSFIAHSGIIISMDFSLDGKLLVTAGQDKKIRVWNTINGNLIYTLDGGANYFLKVKFSFDSKSLIVLYDEVLIYDMNNGKLKDRFKIETKNQNSIVLSNDQKYVICSYSSGNKNMDNNKLLIYDINSKKLIKKLNTDFDNVISVFNIGKNKFRLIDKIKGVYIADINTSEIILQKLSFSNADILNVTGLKTAEFTEDGKYVSLCSDVQASFLDCELGLVTGINCDVKNPSHSIFIGDSTNIIVVGDDRFSVWESNNKSQTLTKKRVQNNVSFAYYYKSLNSIVFSSENASNLKIWSLDECRLKDIIKDVFIFQKSASISEDDQFLITRNSDKKSVSLYNLNKKSKLLTINTDKKILHNFSFSPDNKIIATGGMIDSLHFIDANSGTLEEKKFGKADGGIGCRWQQFSNDGKSLYIFSGSSGIAKYSISTEVLEFKYDQKSGSKNYFNFALSPSNKFLAASYTDEKDQNRYVSIYDTKTGKIIYNLTNIITTNFSYKDTSYINYYYPLAFSKDEKFIACGSIDNIIRIWDISNGKLIKTLDAHNNSITSVSFIKNDKFLLSSSMDGTVRIWNLENNQWTAIFIDPEGYEWTVYTNDGYWDSSKNGGENVAMINEMDCWNIDQFAVHNNRPDIILQRLESKNSNLIAYYNLLYQKRLKKLKIDENKYIFTNEIPKTEINSINKYDKNFEILFTLSDLNYKLKQYNIYVNDVPIFGSYGKKLSDDTNLIKLSEKLELNYGFNKIEVSCMNEKGVESYRALTYARYDKQIKSDLYYIGFGVSKYKDTNLNLEYADKDAKDLALIFSKMNGQYSNVYVNTFTNEQCTVDNIKKAKDLLKNAKIDDTFVLFIAGHGIHDKDREATYYYVTYDADINNLSGTAANFDIIEDILQGISPRNKLFLMDTCESGEIDDTVQAEYFVMANNLGIKSRALKKIIENKQVNNEPKRSYLFEKDRYIYNDLARRSGAIVFSSCKGGEFSYESDTIKNGFFTNKIIESLTNKNTDKNRDGIISTDELRDYVMLEVPKLADGKQNPTVDRDNIYQKFGFQVIK